MTDNNWTTRENLLLAPIPKQTSTYKPISHSQLIDLSLEGIAKAGFVVESEIYESRKHGQVASGKYLIKGIGDNEMQLQAVWQNSYDKSLPLKFVIGAMVLVCTNGMISMRAMNEYRHKHLSDVQEISPLIIPEHIKGAGEVFMGLQGDRDLMKGIEISKKVQAELIGKMFLEQEFINNVQLNILKKEFETPHFNYNAKNTLWEMYNFTTYAIGGFNPTWIQDHVKAHDFFMEYAEEVM